MRVEIQQILNNIASTNKKKWAEDTSHLAHND
jgi:hypothetical protein